MDTFPFPLPESLVSVLAWLTIIRWVLLTLTEVIDASVAASESKNDDVGDHR